MSSPSGGWRDGVATHALDIQCAVVDEGGTVCRPHTPSLDWVAENTPPAPRQAPQMWRLPWGRRRNRTAARPRPIEPRHLAGGHRPILFSSGGVKRLAGARLAAPPPGFASRPSTNFLRQPTPPDPRKQGASSVACARHRTRRLLPAWPSAVAPDQTCFVTPVGRPRHRTWQPLPLLLLRGCGGGVDSSSPPPP